MSVEAEARRPRVWPILQKRTAGQELTADERQTLATYHRAYSKNRKGLYIRKPLLTEWQALADEQGIPFSQWIMERVLSTLQGDSQEVRDLRDRKSVV